MAISDHEIERVQEVWFTLETDGEGVPRPRLWDSREAAVAAGSPWEEPGRMACIWGADGRVDLTNDPEVLDLLDEWLAEEAEARAEDEEDEG